MADSDYESTDQDPGKDTIKYYQIAVPNFQEQSLPSTVPSAISTAVASVTSANPLTSAGSFLRLGSSPDPSTDWTSTTFANSVALAKLAGDPALVATAEGLSTTLGAATDAVTDSFSDGAGLSSSWDSAYGGVGDSNYLLGFADDTRQRATGDSTTASSFAPQTRVNNNTVDNTVANRQAETLRLLTKGGWWDHSDGNRITTTAGDKIEVIQGNYKLVVLGRQAVPTAPASDASKETIFDSYKDLVANAFITDVSGGHFQEQYPSPTPCIKTVEYVQDASGEWTLYQDNGVGNLITKLKGRTVDMFQGSKREAYVGSEDSGTDLDPEIVSKTWAQKISTYTGSDSKPVPLIFSLTYADKIEDIKFASTTIVSTTNAPTVVSETGGGAIASSNIAVVDIFSMNVAPLIETVNAAAAEYDLKLGNYFALGTNKTYVHGNYTTVEGGKQTASMSEEALQGLVTLVAAHTSAIIEGTTDVHGELMAIRGDETIVGEIMNDFRAAKFI